LGVTVVYVPRRFPFRKILSAGSLDEWLLLLFDCKWTTACEDGVAVNK
jgi:hypothetical protein